MSQTSNAMTYEGRVEARLRRIPFAIPVITLLMAGLLYAAIGLCLRAFAAGYWSVIILSGLLVQAFGIILVHDGSHRSITRTGADAVFMNVGAGLVLLPFYAEPFRHYHLIHHAHTNELLDPLWPASKRRLYLNHRRLYMLATMVPFIFTVMALLTPAPVKAEKPVQGPPLRPGAMLLSFAVAFVTYWIVRPPLMFLALTALSVSYWGTLRHWCEHIGFGPSRDSNTFSFPLGMGIGNHDVHHQHPAYSWISLAAGLVRRPKDTNPLRTLWSMWWRPDCLPYPVLRESRWRTR
jgi:fatty acid desaturase